jgi:hypothetical protein
MEEILDEEILQLEEQLELCEEGAMNEENILLSLSSKHKQIKTASKTQPHNLNYLYVFRFLILSLF